MATTYRQWEEDALKAGANFADQQWAGLQRQAVDAERSGGPMPAILPGQNATVQQQPLAAQTIAAPAQSQAPAQQPAYKPPADSTEGIMSRMLSSGSPYLDMARSKAQQAAGARGLVNSSIAAGEGEGAAIEAARGIAAEDANIISRERMNREQMAAQQSIASMQIAAERERQQAAQRWQTEENTIERQWNTEQNEVRRQFEADQANAAHQRTIELQQQGFSFQEAQAKAKQEFDESMAAYDREFQLTRDRANQDFEAAQRQLDRDARADLDSTSNTQSGRGAIANLIGQHQQNIATILADPNMDTAAKNSQLAQLTDAFNQNLRGVAAMYSVDVSDLFATAPTAPQTRAEPAVPGTVPGAGQQGATQVSEIDEYNRNPFRFINSDA